MTRGASSWRLGSLAVSAAVTIALVIAPGSQAATVNGGPLTIKLSKKFRKALKKKHVRTAAFTAQVSQGTLKFPIKSGSVDFSPLRGTLPVVGGFTLQKGGKRLVANPLRLTFQAQGMSLGTRSSVLFYGMAGGKLGPSLDFTTFNADSVNLEFTRKGAKAFNNVLGGHSFTRGMDFGRASFHLDRELTVKPGSYNAIGFHPSLAGCGFVPEPVAPAAFNSSGLLQLPVSGGAINARTGEGSIKHDGGVKLHHGSTAIDMNQLLFSTVAQQVVFRAYLSDLAKVVTIANSRTPPLTLSRHLDADGGDWDYEDDLFLDELLYGPFGAGDACPWSHSEKISDFRVHLIVE